MHQNIYSVVGPLWRKLPHINFHAIKNQLCLSNSNKKRIRMFLGKPLMVLVPCSGNILAADNANSPIYPITPITKYDVDENISHLMSVARMALEKGEIERAEAILEMGIKICEEYQSYVALPYMYDVLASIAFAMGNLRKSEELLVNVIEKMAQLGIADNDSQIIDFKLRIARIYSSYDEKELAEIGFKSCLDQQKLKITDGDTSTKTGMLYVNCLFWYGLHKIKNSDKKTAKKLINRAYDYSTKIKGLSPYQEMVILYTLADLNMEMGENDIALQNMQSAILLGRGIGSVDLPRCFLKLSKIYLNLTAWHSANDAATQAFHLAKIFSDYDTLEQAETILIDLQNKEKT